MGYTRIEQLEDGKIASIEFIDAPPPIKSRIINDDDLFIKPDINLVSDGDDDGIWDSEQYEPWPEDWVDPYYASCDGNEEEEEDDEEFDDDDDDYQDDDFIEDTGIPISDAPPLDIL